MQNHQSVFCPKCQKPCPARAGFCPNCGTQIGHTGAVDDDPYLGNTIDNTFIVESILGSGSMGIVYRARHRAMNSYVALKVLRHDFLSNRVVLTRFQREAQAASCLSHPNVIRILHYGKTFLKAPYIAMECLEGVDLSDLVVREFPLGQRRVANILLQVASALEAAHAAGIIHRDLKPANIIVMPRPGGEELVKVLDFGIAKIVDIEGEGLTREGAICGTPAFMSPEQVLGKAVTPASDLFSLGSILYFMLTCKLPFQGASMVDMATSILSISPPPPSRARLDTYVDPHLERICIQALEKDASRRFPTALAMKEAILAALPNISEPVGNVRKAIVVGDAPPDLVLDEATCCDVPAYQSHQGWSDDREEDKTALQVQAMQSEERPALRSGAVSAVSAAVSHVLSVVAPAVSPASPPQAFVGESTVVQESSVFSDTHDGSVSQDLVARRKSLLLSIVIVVGGLCLIGVLVIVILVNLVLKDAPSNDVPTSAPPVAEAPPQAVPERAELSAWDVSRLSDIAARAAYNAVGWTASFGLIKGVDAQGGSNVPDPKENLPAHTNTGSDKPFQEVPAPTPVVRKVDKPPSTTPAAKPPSTTPAAKPPSTTPAAKPPSTTPAAKPPSTTPAAKPPSTTSSGSTSRSSAIAKKFASAEQAEKNGDKIRACEIYKSLLNDDLSKDDKLTVQSKVRQCSRTL